MMWISLSLQNSIIHAEAYNRYVMRFLLWVELLLSVQILEDISPHIEMNQVYQEGVLELLCFFKIVGRNNMIGLCKMIKN